MKLTPEEFDATFNDTLNAMLEQMAGDPDIRVEKFYSLACFLENLSLFSPVLYSLFKDQAME